jgi:hypothetical protein
VKKSALISLVVLALATVQARGQGATADPKAATATKEVTLRGWITDAMCGARNANPKGKECALRCYKEGSRLVLYSATDKKTYGLSDQALAAKNLGFEVNVRGTLDDKGLSLTVSQIEAAVEKDDAKPGNSKKD